MTIEELRKIALDTGFALTDEMADQLDRYARLLMVWNEKMNLTAIDTYEEIVEKHFHDCLEPLQFADIHGKVCDVGSGAGFPGMVWKIARPDLSMTLLEPIGKRCTFLNEVIHSLDLSGITVVNERAEDFVKEKRESFDVVTARAVANLQVLSEVCIPLVKVDGIFVAMKGAQGNEEVKAAENAVSTLGAALFKVDEAALSKGERRMIITYKKVKNTPAEYPRNYGRIKKNPL